MQFKVPDDDTVYTLVSQKFTFAEGRAFEKVTGVPFEDLMEGKASSRSMVAMQAMYWISMKRKNPTLTFVEIDDLAIDDIEFIPENDDEQALADSGDAVGPTSPAPDSEPDLVGKHSLSVA